MVLTSIGAPVDRWAGFRAAIERISLLTPVRRYGDNRPIRLESAVAVHASEIANTYNPLGFPSSPRADARGTWRCVAETRPHDPIAEMDPHELSLESRVRVPSHVVYRAFVNETVALNLSTGTYHGLNPTAGRMLEAVNAADTLNDAATTLASDNAWDLATVQSDLTGLCKTLLESGLLEIVDSDSS